MVPVGSANRSGGFTIVLGAGGRVGMASHAGVLRALDEVGGLDPRDASLVIGTSAGSVIGALLRLGWSTEEIWGVATRTSLPDEPGHDVGRQDLFQRSWTNPSQLLRRSLGSAFVVSRSVVRLPLLPVPGLARAVFPGGFITVNEEADDVGVGFPDDWPNEDLWLCAVDIETGRRIVLGRDEMPALSLAVLASCAIPGYYQPVRLGSRTLVDGGVHSTTNLDLAGRVDTPVVIASAPMAYDPRRAPGLLSRTTRRPINRGLARDRMGLRSKGRSVLLVRPGREELAAHGINPMRSHGLEPVAVAAYDATARLVASPRIRRLLADAHESVAPVAEVG